MVISHHLLRYDVTCTTIRAPESREPVIRELLQKLEPFSFTPYLPGEELYKTDSLFSLNKEGDIARRR